MASSGISVAVVLGAEVQVSCRTFLDEADGLPELVIDLPGTRLGVRPAGFTLVTDDDVINAKGLVEAAAVYLEQVTRLHAKQQGSRAGGSGSEGSGSVAA